MAHNKSGVSGGDRNVLPQFPLKFNTKSPFARNLFLGGFLPIVWRNKSYYGGWHHSSWFRNPAPTSWDVKKPDVASNLNRWPPDVWTISSSVRHLPRMPLNHLLEFGKSQFPKMFGKVNPPENEQISENWCLGKMIHLLRWSLLLNIPSFFRGGSFRGAVGQATWFLGAYFGQTETASCSSNASRQRW